MNIVLLGYRGSGKTSVGKMLASKLWKTFVDVDRETCKRFDNASIADIWQRHGEPAWRDAEAAVTVELLGYRDQVIALGGGTVMIPSVRHALAEAADRRVFYLRCDPAELHRRIHGDQQSSATRPSLTAMGGGIEEIQAVLAEREPVYRSVADEEFDVTRTDIAETVRYLIQRL